MARIVLAPQEYRSTDHDRNGCDHADAELHDQAADAALCLRRRLAGPLCLLIVLLLAVLGLLIILALLAVLLLGLLVILPLLAVLLLVVLCLLIVLPLLAVLLLSLLIILALLIVLLLSLLRAACILCDLRAAVRAKLRSVRYFRSAI